MIEYASYDMPISYEGIIEEHQACRNHAGLFDVSHMGEILLEGPDALRFTNHLVTNTVIEPYKVIYALMCDEDGFVVDDLLVYPYGETKVLLVVNAANKDKDVAWVLRQQPTFDVSVTDMSQDYSQIAIQGPNAVAMFQSFAKETFDDLAFMTFKEGNVINQTVIVSRTGYTGEDGFEVYGAHDEVVKIFDTLIELGAKPCGLGCRDTLRFEANLPLYGHEISETINPVEAGLNFAIKLDKPFIGRDALVASKEDLKRKLVSIELLERGIPRQGYLVFDGDKQIGEITTGYVSPTLNLPIANALLDIEYTKLGTEIEVLIRKNRVKARVRNKKFYTKNYKK